MLVYTRVLCISCCAMSMSNTLHQLTYSSIYLITYIHIKLIKHTTKTYRYVLGAKLSEDAKNRLKGSYAEVQTLKGQVSTRFEGVLCMFMHILVCRHVVYACLCTYTPLLVFLIHPQHCNTLTTQ